MHRSAKQGVALTIEITATLRTGDADPTAGTVDVAVRKWKQGDGEDGYYYTGSAWQVGATSVESTQGDGHAHTVEVDATRMGNLAGFDLSARTVEATAIGPTTWVHIEDEFNSKSNDTIDAKTTNLPTDPADASVVAAGQVSIIAEIDANETKIDAIKTDTAAILTDTNEIQGKLPSGDICNEPTGSRAIVIHTQEADTTAIPQVAVSIWADSLHTNLVTRVTSDVSANASLSLDDGTYYYTAVKSLYTFVAGSFVVSVDATHNVTGVSAAPSSPSSPELCVIYGTVLDGSGDPISGETVSAKVQVPATSSGNQLSHEQVSTTTNSSGYFELELVRGSTVEFKLFSAGLASETYLVPDAANQDVTTWETT